MAGRNRIVPRTDLNTASERCMEQRARLPEPLRSLSGEAAHYPVRHSEKLEGLLDEVRRRIERAARI